MQHESDMEHESAYSSYSIPRWVIGVAGFVVILVGGSWLTAWLLGPAARWSAAGCQTVKANMSLGLVLSGAGLLLLMATPLGMWRRLLGSLAAVVILLIGSLTLIQLFVGVNLHIDQMIAAEAPGAAATVSPNRIGPPGSISLALLGIALLARAWPWRVRLSVPYLGLAVCLINLIPLMGFIYGISEFYGKAKVTGIAWPAVISMMALGVGLILLEPRHGPAALLLRRDPGGALLRMMLPAAVMLPLLLGLVFVLGERWEIYRHTTGVGLLTIGMGLLFASMLWRSADDVSRSVRRQRLAEQHQAQGRQRLESILSSITNGYYVLDSDWRFLEANRISQEHFARPLAELRGRNIWDLTSTPVDSPMRRAFEQAVATGEPAHFEIQSRVRAGFWAQMHLYPRSGRLEVYYADISARKQAEQALRDSELFYRQTLASIPGMVFTTRPDGYCDYQSQQWVEFTGVPMAEHLGDGWNRLLHPDDRANAYRAWRHAVEGRATYDLDYRVRRHDGQYQWFKVRGRPICDEAGTIVRWFGIATNINDLKMADQALQQGLRRFELLSQVSAQLLHASKPQELVESLCIRVMEHLGCDAFFNFLVDDPAGKLHLNAYAGIAPHDAAKIEWLDCGVAVCGYAARDACRIVAEHIGETPDTRTELVKGFGIKAYAAHPLLGPRGKVLGTLSFGTRSQPTFSSDDLSLMQAVAAQVAVAMVRMQDEQALRLSQQQLLQINQTLEGRVAERTAHAEEQSVQLRALATQLNQAEQRERKRIAHILHDHFQQLLVGARFNLSLIGSTSTDANVSKELDLVSQVLAEAIEASRSLAIELSPPVLHDSGLAAGLEWLGRWMQEHHPLQVTVTAEPQIEPCDENVRIVLFHAAQELLLNVVKHANARSATIGAARLDDQFIRLVVSDDGLGLSPDAAASKSTGFGLFSIRERLRVMGGQFALQSEPGHGTTIVLTMPSNVAAPEPTDES